MTRTLHAVQIWWLQPSSGVLGGAVDRVGVAWLGNRPQQLMALSPGTTIGHYDVTALLGEGGMGQVWRDQWQVEGRGHLLRAAQDFDVVVGDPSRQTRLDADYGITDQRHRVFRRLDIG